MLHKNKTTIMLTHTDMDGESCLILARSYFKNIIPFRISYNNIKETLLEIKECYNTNDNLQMIITDLNFSKEDFDILLEIIHLFDDVVFIDHHLYEFEMKSVKNLQVIIKRKYCACALFYAFMLQYKGFEFNKDFVSLVNTYDLWHYKSSKFEEACNLNMLFWDYGAKRFNNVFLNTPYITPSQEFKIERIKNNINSYYEEMENKGLIIYNKLLCFSFLDKHIGELKFKYNSILYANIRNSYHFSLRIADEINEDDAKVIRDTIFEAVPTYKLINKGGHIHAFGITCEVLEIDEIKDYFNKIQNASLHAFKKLGFV